MTTMAAVTSKGGSASNERELTTGGIFKGAAIGAATGAVGNSLLFLAGRAAGVSMVAEFAKGQPATALAIGPVVMASFVPAIGAALLTLLLNKLSSRPSKVLLGIAVVFGLLSMGGPATIPGAEAGLRVLLALMHVISGVAITGGILRFARRG
jgi:hypothetical protein